MKANDQVFISYGEKSNSQLLQFYGFVIPGNPFPVTFKLEMPNNDKAEFKLPDAAAVPSVELLSSLRVRENRKGGEKVDPISIRSELNVMNQLINACHVKLQAFTHTLSGDLEMLQNSDLTFNQRNIIQVNSEVKAEIHKLIEFCEYMKDLLLMEPEEAISVIQNRKTDTWTIYLKDDLLPLLQGEITPPTKAVGIDDEVAELERQLSHLREVAELEQKLAELRKTSTETRRDTRK